MVVQKIVDAIRDDAKQEILERYFSAEYIDDDSTFQYTQDRLLEYKPNWRDALMLWRMYEYDFAINKRALAEYVAKIIPKEEASEALDICPDQDLLAEYLFDEDKLAWYARKAWAETDTSWILAIITDRGLRIESCSKESEECVKLEFVKQGACQIVNMQTDQNGMLLDVECNGQTEQIKIPFEWWTKEVK